MKVAKLKQDRRIERNRYEKSKKVKAYGENNDYPQAIRDITKASRTAVSCLNVYAKFIKGAGFSEATLNSLLVGKRKTLFQLHGQIAADFSEFRGFAVHVNYNGLLDEIGYTLVPFEQCRLEVDGDKNLTGRIAVHPDWTGVSGKPFKNEDIKYFMPYTGNKADVIAIVKALGGFDKFEGLLFYYVEDADEYPEATLDPVRELMVAQGAADNVRVRNVKFNYLPSGILYKKAGKQIARADESDDESDEDSSELANTITEWQGDANAAKIIVIEQEDEEEDLLFKPFPVQNMDKFSEHTDKEVDEGIRSFMGIPPELLGREGGRGFASETLTQAYTFYNSMTSSERDSLQRAYEELFWNLLTARGLSSAAISPLKYMSDESVTTA